MSRMPWRSQTSRIALEVARRRRDRAERGADDRLGDEGDDALRAESPRSSLRAPAARRSPYCSGVSPARAVAVLVAGRDVATRRSAAARTACAATRCRRPRARPACCRDSSGGGAMKTLRSRLADLDEVLARELERRFHRLRAAADEVHVAIPAGACAISVSASSSATSLVKKRCARRRAARSARASPRARRDACGRGRRPPRRRNRRGTVCRSSQSGTGRHRPRPSGSGASGCGGKRGSRGDPIAGGPSF